MSEINEQIAARRRARRERLASLSNQSITAELSAPETLKRLIELATGLALGFMLEGARIYAHEEKARGIYEQVAWRDLISRLKAEVAALPEPERTVLAHHYGGALTFEHIGNLMGLARSRVSQIHRTALASLKERLARRQSPIPD